MRAVSSMLLIVLAVTASRCQPAGEVADGATSPEAEPPRAPPAPPPLPSRLSETGLYVGGGTTRVDPAHLSFSPQYPLWTDGATKRRFLALPRGTWIDASNPDAWRFPAGTRIWKEFSFAGRRVETRYMEALAGGTWRYATYVWLPDESDALLAPASGAIVGVGDAGKRHAIPSAIDCALCHEGSASPVLGFTALQLSSDRDPNALHASAPGERDVDLDTLVARGLVRGLPATIAARPPRIDAASPTERAALGYLHGNCGGCHNAEGPLASLGLVLLQSVARPTDRRVLASTIDRASHFRPPDSPDAALRIAPGDADRSVLALRMSAREPLSQMPPIGTLEVDEEAVALVRRWITEDLATRPRVIDSPTLEEIHP